MHRKTLRTFALISGLGLLPACPVDTATETLTESTGASTTGGVDPSGDPGGTPTPTGTTPPGDTTDDPTTGLTDTTAADPDTSSTAADTDTSTGEPIDNLCTRLGGADGIQKLVEGLFGKLLVDEKINGYFLNSDLDAANLGSCVAAQIGVIAECPGAEYTCKSMLEAHAGLGISQQDFDDFVADFVAAYDDHAVDHPALTAADKAALGDALGATVGDIVTDPDNNLTVYQRVGRKPAIRALIGHPGEAGSFVDNVANDAAINSFFAAAMFERLNTCLTRQVAGIDGPVHYGKEVDAPDPIDPGVALDDPCKDMKSVHAGLQDDQMEGITLEDFTLLAMDLVTAMDTFMIAPGDQDTILAVLGTMCEDIVADPNTCPGNTITELDEATDLNLSIDNLGDKWDDKYNGKLTSMLCVELEAPDNGVNKLADVRLKVGMDHTYVGDLTIKVVAPDATLLTALGRPGPEPVPIPDNGVACCGDDSNLTSTNPFVLSDAATVPGKDMGKTIGNANVICKDENPKIDPCQFKPYPGGGPGTAFSDFKGKPANGTWQVCFGDSGKGDYGKLQYVGLTLVRQKY